MNWQSLKHFATRFGHVLGNKLGRTYLFTELNKKLYLKSYISRTNDQTEWKALREAINWFCYNQDQMADAGFGTYYIGAGFTSSYPETTGYIVPTLLRFAEIENDDNIRERAKNALNWLIAIQKPSGGWQSGYVHQEKAAVVFNTGQVIRGMLAGYHKFGDLKYLSSAEKAADWLVKIQAEDGSFNKHVYLDVARVYDSYVVAPVLELHQILPKPEYLAMARANFKWIIEQNQHPNGWFANCDNTLKGNQMPILHTIAYTTDGLLDGGILLGDATIIAAAKKPADILLEKFLKDGILHGRYNQNWQGSEDFITTGGAQMAIVWHKLAGHFGEEKYVEGVQKMNRLLVAIQQRHIAEPRETKGALFGSFPFWGRYERFGCPNWATKYFADSLMNRAEAIIEKWAQ